MKILYQENYQSFLPTLSVGGEGVNNTHYDSNHVFDFNLVYLMNFLNNMNLVYNIFKAKNVDGMICHGDSGSPMIVRNNGSFYQIGKSDGFRKK